MPRIVLAAGCFDLLHVAHVRHLREAKEQGELLVVGITEDEHVGKPGRPIIPQEERREMVQALGCVWRAWIFRDSMDALQKVKPSVFCKGSDYIAKGLLPEEIAYCKKHGIEIYHTQPNPQTTSGIIEKIKCAS